MIRLEDDELAEDLVQALRDACDYGDWRERKGYARLDAKARYDIAMRRLGFLLENARP